MFFALKNLKYGQSVEILKGEVATFFKEYDLAE